MHSSVINVVNETSNVILYFNNINNKIINDINNVFNNDINDKINDIYELSDKLFQVVSS